MDHGQVSEQKKRSPAELREYADDHHEKHTDVEDVSDPSDVEMDEAEKSALLRRIDIAIVPCVLLQPFDRIVLTYSPNLSNRRGVVVLAQLLGSSEYWAGQVGGSHDGFEGDTLRASPSTAFHRH